MNNLDNIYFTENPGFDVMNMLLKKFGFIVNLNSW